MSAEENDVSNNKTERWYNWKPLAAFVYLFICLMDFVIMPVLIHQHNTDVLRRMLDMNQAQMAQTMDRVKLEKWEPMTLSNAGVFHMAFATMLTGAAFVNTLRNNRRDTDNSQPQNFN